MNFLGDFDTIGCDFKRFDCMHRLAGPFFICALALANTQANAQAGASIHRSGICVARNTVEGHFSIFKRGMRGVYQHSAEKHLRRYLAEFDFRYNHRIALGYNDGDRATLAVKGAAGKRLTYHLPHQTGLF